MEANKHFKKTKKKQMGENEQKKMNKKIGDSD